MCLAPIVRSERARTEAETETDRDMLERSYAVTAYYFGLLDPYLLVCLPACLPAGSLEPGQADGGQGLLGVHGSPERHAAEHNVQLLALRQAQRRDAVRCLRQQVQHEEFWTESRLFCSAPDRA